MQFHNRSAVTAVTLTGCTSLLAKPFYLRISIARGRIYGRQNAPIVVRHFVETVPGDVMKNRFLVCLFLFVAFLALSALAQQSDSSSTKTSTTMSNGDTREPLTEPKPKDFWDGDDPNIGNLLIHPFATKAYVRRHTEPIRDRLKELDEIRGENATKIRDIDARSTQGLQLASEKVNLADQHATDASSKAQAAQAAASQASTNVVTAEAQVSRIDQYKSDAQTEIRFRPGQTVLSKTAKDALDQMAAPLKGQHSYIIEVRGFAPGHGTAAIASSQKMADSVVRYLVETHQIPVYRIFVTGMGSASVADQGTVKHSSAARVEVSVLKNETVAQR